jgi:hypothetical protein
MVIYDQTKHKDTRHACTLYTLLIMIKFDFWVKIEDDLILKLVYYAERIWALSLTQWAYFAVIYPALIKFINLRYWINLALVNTDTRNGIMREWITYALWLKQLSNLQQILALDDKEFSKADVDRVISDKRWGWHALAYKDWFVIDPWKWIVYRMTKETLVYAVNKWLFYATARHITPVDKFTTILQKSLLTSLKVKRKKSWDIKQFLTYTEFKEIKRNVKIYLNK